MQVLKAACFRTKGSILFARNSKKGGASTSKPHRCCSATRNLHWSYRTLMREWEITSVILLSVKKLYDPDKPNMGDVNITGQMVE